MPDFVLGQKGTPLQVAAVTLSLDELYKQVLVVNVSNKKILRAQLGWTVGHAGRPDDPAMTFVGPQTDINLPPGEITALGPQGASMSLTTEVLQRLGYAHGRLEIGAVYVKFEDGTEWSYPLSPSRKFESQKDPVIQRKVFEKLKQWRTEHPFPTSLSEAGSTSSSGYRLVKVAGPCGAVKNAPRSLLSQMFELFVPKAYAQPGWTIVCNSAVRNCANYANGCETGTCDPGGGGCSFSQCCILDLFNGDTDCF